MRKAEEAFDLIMDLLPLATERYLDPKNQVKGHHRNIEPMKLNRYIQTEALELSQAYRNKEGLVRELEEIGDIVLFCAYRADQIFEQMKKETKWKIEN